MFERIVDAGNRWVTGWVTDNPVRWLQMKISNPRHQGSHQDSEQETAHQRPPSFSLEPNAFFCCWSFESGLGQGEKAWQIAPVVLQILPAMGWSPRGKDDVDCT